MTEQDLRDRRLIQAGAILGSLADKDEFDTLLRHLSYSTADYLAKQFESELPEIRRIQELIDEQQDLLWKSGSFERDPEKWIAESEEIMQKIEALREQLDVALTSAPAVDHKS